MQWVCLHVMPIEYIYGNRFLSGSDYACVGCGWPVSQSETHDALGMEIIRRSLQELRGLDYESAELNRWHQWKSGPSSVIVTYTAIWGRLVHWERNRPSQLLQRRTCGRNKRLRSQVPRQRYSHKRSFLKILNFKIFKKIRMVYTAQCFTL